MKNKGHQDSIVKVVYNTTIDDYFLTNMFKRIKTTLSSESLSETPFLLERSCFQKVFCEEGQEKNGLSIRNVFLFFFPFSDNLFSFLTSLPGNLANTAFSV